ncbi:exodeoxyribonuclease VII small subunit [Campylobacter sp. faydin G-24]|uniref:Exodeoxyribonuclease VII small subunit n=1 Tax=Campylobacter anatolicus TaxID=2829105 RepID=A0ABS5HGK8_9BACT|nr:exodeoxyribonuclease VII small subunit [Campylobacter anatolicus]MBR8462406.1 exodeoxyribonuclease VII small subunit [Campylobacter anatolicus]MBR8463145.1 exodeoxyribonuclease VII small subunit [Campylobacter anatolicus]MBR8465535.1 exodeoxyribonuclease VII small subunit [Campylobacter anatolicus]
MENSQTFEDKIKQANEILANLNKDEVSLMHSVELHKQGKQLLAEAREILQKAELSIQEVDDE